MRMIFAFLLLCACGRMITDGEQHLVGDIMGDTLNTAQVRMVEAGFIGVVTRTYPTRPQTTCREKINMPPSGPTIQTRTAGAVAWTHVLTNPNWTLEDYAPEYPQAYNLIAAMYFAHEMVHVWQWQNRATTGYSPFRGLAEHKPGVDPYLLDPNDETTFLDLGYEQQAVLVEEFMCCRALAPHAARTHRLYETLRGVMPVRAPTQTPQPTEVYGVYENANLDGVCD